MIHIYVYIDIFRKEEINVSVLHFQGGGIPRRSAPVLQMIREEV